MPTAKAGWCQVDITPPLGLPLGDRGPRFSPANEIRDPLCGQVLLMEDSKGTRQMWVSLDLIGLSYRSGAQLRYELAAISGTPYENVVVNFSHTHSGPMTNFDKYATRVEPPPALIEYDLALHHNLMRAAAQALDRLQAVKINIYRGHSHIGINRRNRDAQGAMGLRPNATGCYNSELWLMNLKSAADRTLIFNYGCHPVLVYGFAWNAVSADFPGVCRRYLIQHLGDATHCQFIQGLAGNVRPRVVADLEENRFRTSIPKDLEATGSQLANDILQTLIPLPRTR
jgi:neutral ceramidase